MNWLNLISIPFILFFAWAKGQRLIRWVVIAYLIGFWSLIPLLIVKTRAIKIYKIPNFVTNYVTSSSFKRQLKGIQYPTDI
jgi:phosphoglycerol transferase MdoB-like AlkP superfamily enzyme